MEEFISPPEAPVFQPTPEEFKDPISYITKIRPVVVNTGICKIRPPPGWKPPFSVDVDKFTFTPRVQPLNELEAKTRVKLNFLESLAKFWELQGISFKIPNVNKHPLDMHRVFKVVTQLGGFEEVTRIRRWKQIATQDLGYENPNVSGAIRVHYEKYLYPYEKFLMKSGELGQLAGPSHREQEAAKTDTKCKYGLRHNRHRLVNWEERDGGVEMDERNPEFRKLAFTSPGPKNSFAPLQRRSYQHHQSPTPQPRPPPSPQSLPPSSPLPHPPPIPQLCPPSNPLEQDETPAVKEEPSDEGVEFAPPSPGGRMEGDRTGSAARTRTRVEVPEEVYCRTCHRGDMEEELLLCDSCDASFHMSCLDPPLHALPPGDWRCPNCVAEECFKPLETFGFEQAKKQYTLSSYGQMANAFKQNYFNMAPKEVPCSVVEKEFWRLVSSIEDDVVVEYGADLHTSKHGSGFPMATAAASAEERSYACSGWNLNNIPNLPGSVLHYIDTDISGMKVPWVYAGMCFSCFCWHIEDHWSYSINYLHWGEPKTWYGVPSAYAESLEATMKEQAPELFEHQPDLMHHLVTILSPSVLMKHGIPVVRTDQCAGDFVVTFPRAYHAGFNQGLNFAEAVNFAIPDWLPMGRCCIAHYRQFRHLPVFSHDEVLCKMVAQSDHLELGMLLSAHEDAAAMVTSEDVLRQEVEEKGVSSHRRELFELASDEERQCCVCNTSCFLSAVRCSCDGGKIACPHHVDTMCSCPLSQRVFRYRYTMEELRGLVAGVQERAQGFSDWSQRVETLLDGVGSVKTDMQHLHSLVDEAVRCSYSVCPLFEELAATIRDAEQCVSTAAQLVIKHRPSDTTPALVQPCRPSGSRGLGLDVAALREFLKQVECLPCTLPETSLIKERLAEVESFQEQVAAELQAFSPEAVQAPPPSERLEELILAGEQLEVAMPELNTLRTVLQQSRWVVDAEQQLAAQGLGIEALRSLLKQGATLQPAQGLPVVDAVLSRVRALFNTSQDWEQRAKNALKIKPSQSVSFLESLLTKTEEIPVVMPSMHAIAAALEKARLWNKQAQVIQESDKHPHFDTLKVMLSSGRPIPVQLDLLAQLESRYTAAKAWADRASKTFMKKSGASGLLEVLLPRAEESFVLQSPRSKKKPEGDLVITSSPLSGVGGDRLKEMDTIREMERVESRLVRETRRRNLEKMERDEQMKSGAVTGAPVLYCFCRRPESGYMLQCELCNEWFHAACLHIPKGKKGGGGGKDTRFLCPSCLRTRRPRLDAVVSLLISLQKVPVAISEGTAIHCLAERAIAWQRRARQAISNGNSMLECARQQSKRVGEIRNHVLKWKAETEANKAGQTLATSIEAQLASTAGSVLQHYEAELQRLKTEYAGLSGGKRHEMEQLLVEGDLLEVTLDEVLQLYWLMQSDAELQLAYDKDGKEEELSAMREGDVEGEGGRKRRRKCNDISPAPSSKADGSAPKEPAQKRRKRMTPLPPGRASKSSTPSSPACSERSASSRAGLRRSGSHSSNEGLGCSEEVPDEGEEAEEEEEGECSARPRCLQPVAKEIGWVQCDRCQAWFHLVCVGLTRKAAETIDSYLCSSCKPPPILIPTVSPLAPTPSSLSSSSPPALHPVSCGAAALTAS